MAGAQGLNGGSGSGSVGGTHRGNATCACCPTLPQISLLCLFVTNIILATFGNHREVVNVLQRIPTDLSPSFPVTDSSHWCGAFVTINNTEALLLIKVHTLSRFPQFFLEALFLFQDQEHITFRHMAPHLILVFDSFSDDPYFCCPGQSGEN